MRPSAFGYFFVFLVTKSDLLLRVRFLSLSQYCTRYLASTEGILCSLPFLQKNNDNKNTHIKKNATTVLSSLRFFVFREQNRVYSIGWYRQSSFDEYCCTSQKAIPISAKVLMNKSFEVKYQMQILHLDCQDSVV